MAVNKKTIQRRIKSVRNTRKITKAMELVAAAKMRRANAAVVKTRPYAQRAWQAVRDIMRQAVDIAHPLMVAPKDASRALLVLIASDRGLAGGYNVNVLRKAAQFVAERGADNVDIIAVGRRAESLTKTGAKMAASFHGLSGQPSVKELLPIIRLITATFAEGKHKDVHVGYTDFVSGMTQTPKISLLLPLIVYDDAATTRTAYTFEPGPIELLQSVLPGIIETKVYHALLEAAASEHAARMMAMRSATDSATEMLDDLTFTYNQARQAGITQEIAELVSGTAAISK